MCFLSIIVPVYNVEKYIEKCILSIIDQSFQDFELILVNDGSKDNSIQIAEKLLINREQVGILHQENKGQSVARNLGLQKAKGKYIFFIDSDDFLLSNDDLKLLVKHIENNNFPDLVLHEETRIYNNEVIHYENNINDTKSIRSGDFIKDLRVLIFNELFVASPWDKIIKREILLNNQLFFPEGLKSEDMIWTSNLIPFICNYSCFERSIYGYRKNVSDSITKSINEQHLMDIVFMLKGVLVKQIPSNDHVYEAFWAEHYVFLLMNSDCIKLNKNEFWEFIKENKFLIQKDYTKNVNKVYKFKEIVGFKITTKLLVLFRIVNNFNRKHQLIHE
ncbi:glycosyltransferase family 2 protein [Empedobacter sedimenti]|uniref:glycosyltransferase family 2 protein n=1 Tax=Empedobacter sedimenti TaxID=3042610 RepID=UPI0024A6CD31|nr:glycosyltransferase [Empedobacter sedimenti]